MTATTSISAPADSGTHLEENRVPIATWEFWLATLLARITAHHTDGLTELTAGGASIFVPRVARAPGETIRIRIAAQ